MKNSANWASPVIFMAFVLALTFGTYVLVRGFAGIGVLNPGMLSRLLLTLVGILLATVWGTIFFIGYQLRKMSRDS